MKRVVTLPALLAIGTLLLFLGLSLTYLDRFPVVGQDEPWIIAPSLKLALHGVYGSDLFAGYYGAQQHDYQAMPLYPLVVAGSFKLFGVGLIQARLVSVLLGFLTLALTYVAGRRLVGTVAASLACVLLVLWRVAAYGPVFGSGVPLLDLSRIARYDVAVAPLVLLACAVLVRGLDRQSGLGVIASGFLVGLAALCQLYGAFWLPVLGLLVVVHSGWAALRSRYLTLVLAGFVAAIVPWLIYVALHWADYLGQMRFYTPHFQLLDPGFYLTNLRAEYLRYPLPPLTRLPGLVAALLLIALPVALIALLREAYRTRNTGLAAAGLGLVLPLSLYALLDSEKMFNHVIALFPFGALTLGWGCWKLWVWSRRTGHSRWPLRAAIVAGLAVLIWDGIGGIDHQRAAAAATLPYSQFEARIDRMLPAHALVLGSPEFELGLRSHPYRSLLLPFLLSDRATSSVPLSFEAALERVAPSVILVERPVEQYLNSIAPPASPGHAVYTGLESYLRRHHGRLVGQVTAAKYFYSPVRVYAVPIDHP